ncbi:hypothetical protein ABZ924_36230 [Streptomyces sp. NPDC046876]|uniref:hypothetical protein n=1 Tax=Streptomyces sp. NPDC046876 TaxID=3155616 RepID=UPI0033CC944A
MPVHVVRRASGLPVLAAVTVLSVVGCAADPGKRAPEPAPSSAPPSVSALPPAYRPLTAEQLVAAALPAGAGPDSYGNPVSVRKNVRGSSPEPESSDPACAELFAAAHARHVSRPTPVVAEQTFNWKGGEGGDNGGNSTLASYGATGAQDAFRLVTQGLSTCHSYESQGPGRTYDWTITFGAAPHLGNEAVQFEATAPTESGPLKTRYTVVRTGSVVATFTKRVAGDLDMPAFPPDLIAQQISLLQQAQS